MGKDHIKPWLQLIHKSIHEIRANQSDINPYGITNEAEFFAVVSEYFFKRPDLLHEKRPALFARLEEIFRQNPMTADKTVDSGDGDGQGMGKYRCMPSYREVPNSQNHYRLMNLAYSNTRLFVSLIVLGLIVSKSALAQIGVGAKPIKGAEVFFDGSRKMLDEKWTYWQGPRLAATLPIKWQIEKDPAGPGTVMNTNDPAAAGGKYGSADIVTKETFRDFRLHIEFYISKPGGNSGVYLQNRYEIQVLDGDTTKHGLAAVINETPSPYYAYNGVGKWNAYDIEFRAARFENGKRTEPAMLTMYFNGKKVHSNQKINQVWGGPNSGIDGGNDGGKGITDTPGGLKLQAEGHDVLYRNIWIKKLDLKEANTNF